MVTVEMRRDAHLPFMRGSIFGKFSSIKEAETKLKYAVLKGIYTDEIFDFYENEYIKSMQATGTFGEMRWTTFDRYSVQEEETKNGS
jgi:hypothetical protein